MYYDNYNINLMKCLTKKHTIKVAPIGQLPYLTVDNKTIICQSLAIARFVANRTNLNGNDDLERAKADAIVHTSYDFQAVYYSKVHPFKKDESKIGDIKKNFFNNEVPLYLGRYENLVKMYGSKGFSVGDNLKWSDLSIYDTLSIMFFINMDIGLLEAFPRVNEIFKTVENNPKIKEYVKNRPDAPF